MLAATQMNRSGHIIILKPELDLKQYESLDHVKKNSDHLKRLRKILNFIKPEIYRGTGREHFDSSPFWVNDKGILEDWQDSDHKAYRNSDAKKQLAIYEDKNTPNYTLDDLCFYSLDEMKTVFELIKNKADYEILEIIENEETTDDRTIGFDVGYIGVTFFPLLQTQQ